MKKEMKKSLCTLLLLIGGCLTMQAQDVSKFKTLNDSAYQTTTEYQAGNIYPVDKMKHFASYLRFSDLMAAYNPRITIDKKSWEDNGHKNELYLMPAPKIPADFQQPKLFEGQVVFVMGKRTFSSAGMLFTLARDNHIGTIIGTTSAFSPSHYGEILPYKLPNTGVLGSISCKFFARPDAASVDDECMEPDIKVNLDDKDASWRYIIENYGNK